MKNRIIRFLVVTVLILIILLLREKLKHRPERVIEVPVYQYIPDTTLTSKIFELEKKLRNKIPPKEVIKWRTPDSIPFEIKIIPDSLLLIIQGLEDSLYISNKYIANFPKADKLISFDLNKDSLNITTINIQGVTHTNYFELFLESYNYQWYDNNLHSSFYKPHSAIIPNRKYKTRFNQLYLNIGYDYFNKGTTLGMDYSIITGRFKFSTDINLVIKKEYTLGEAFNTNIKLGYRIFK